MPKEDQAARLERLAREAHERAEARDLAADGGGASDAHHHPAEAATDADARERQLQAALRLKKEEERLTQQVAAAVHEAVGARGVAVCVECRHMCMAMRGVCKPDAVTATFAYTGDFAADRGLRLEFFGALRRDPAFADAGAAAADCAGALGER